MEFENLLSCDISLRNRRNYLSCKFNNKLQKLLLRFVQVFITPEQSQYLRACKIHGAKRGSHDRRFTDFKAAICSCRSIEVIAIHAVNSGSNNPDYSRSSSFLHFLSFSLPSATLLSLFFFEIQQTHVAILRLRKDP